MKHLLGALVLFAAPFGAARAQDPKATVSQKEIDTAILKGSEYLKTAPSYGGWLKTNCDELILLTLIHAGVSEKATAPLLEKCLGAPLEYTYKVALLAMCLEELDASKYQGKIAQCAQFLVDNQASNGQWSYGRPTDATKAIPFEDKSVASGDDKKKKKSEVREFGGESREHKRPKTSYTVKQTRTVGDKGDNSNSQYASLGLRACFDANIKLPEEVLQKARTWWVESQGADENGAKIDKKAVTTGNGEVAYVRGWNYQKASEEGNPTHSMTAGAVGACVIYEYMLGRDWKKDNVTKAGVNWLGKHFTVSDNLYYMYALERAGMLYNTELFGGHNWYLEGARYLVDHQKADGSWGTHEGDKKDESTWDTCFAVLFLKKATRAIATEGGGSRK